MARIANLQGHWYCPSNLWLGAMATSACWAHPQKKRLLPVPICEHPVVIRAEKKRGFHCKKNVSTYWKVFVRNTWVASVINFTYSGILKKISSQLIWWYHSRTKFSLVETTHARCSSAQLSRILELRCHRPLRCVAWGVLVAQIQRMPLHPCLSTGYLVLFVDDMHLYALR